MSDTTNTETQDNINKRVYHPNPVLKWSAITSVDNAPYGEITDGSIEVDSTTSGRLDIWAVPKCEAYPEGLWVQMFNGEFFEASEPGVEDWNKHLLCKIRFNGFDSTVTYDGDESDRNKSGGDAGIEFADPIFYNHIDMVALQPKGINIISVDSSTVDGAADTYMDLDTVFTGEVSGTWTVNVHPYNCTLKGFASDPNFVLSSGETKPISGTKEEINAELEHVQIHTGDSNCSVAFNWDYEQNATILVKIPVADSTDEVATK